jgi:tetratricopeptide (TPR) repeat protein
MQSLLVAAGTDCSMGRHASAREKYEVLVWYFLNSRALLLAALALNGLGEVHARTGNPAAAGPLFEQAMALATDGPVPSVPIMFTVAWNLGRLRLEEGRPEDAAAYFGVAQQCGAVMRSADLKLMAMEQHGAALLASGKPAEALALWEAGATVGDQLGMKEHRDAALRRLQAYHALRDPLTALDYERRMAADVIGPPTPVPTSLTGVPIDVPR